MSKLNDITTERAPGANRETERWYQMGDKQFAVFRVGGIPCYEAHGPITEDYIGPVPFLEVQGQKHWGHGLAWKDAEKLLSQAVDNVPR